MKNRTRALLAVLLLGTAAASHVSGQEIVTCDDARMSGYRTPAMELDDALSLALPFETETSIIDVLLLVTEDRLEHVTLDQERVWATVEISYTNQALAVSGAAVQFRLVGVRAASYREVGTSIDTLLWAANSPQVEAWRNQYGADVVTISAYAGGSRALLGPDPSAFVSVVSSIHAAPSAQTRAHELGHSLGLRHNIEDDPEGTREHGHRWCASFHNCWKDIMSYDQNVDPTFSYAPLPRYSNPFLFHQSFPTGVIGISEGAQVATENARIISAFKPTVIPDPCAPDVDTMCLGEGGRFKVEVTWKDYAGTIGTGKVAPAGTTDSGLFYFFTANNWELLVKVLDGCGLNQQYWVFFAATTDVEFEVTVTDSVTGAVQQWTNALGHPANAVNETAAFGCGDASPGGRRGIRSAGRE